MKKNYPDIQTNPFDNKINLSLLAPNDIKALQAVIPEELLAREGLNNPNVLSDFIKKNALDRLKQNPLMSHGLKGILSELENNKEKDWKPFLAKVIDHIESGFEPSANSDFVKDYLKQRIESQLPNQKLSEQQSFDAKARLKHYQDTLKDQAELSAEVSQHLEDSELAKEIQPTIKKYKEFKSKSKIFTDLIRCIGGES